MKKKIFKYWFFICILLIMVRSLVFCNNSSVINNFDIDEESFDLKMSNSGFDDWELFPLEVISTESVNDSRYPSLAVDSAGNVHIMWADEADYNGSGTDWDIFYKYFNRTTNSWSNLEVVTSESTLQTNTPSLAVDHKGNIHVTYQEHMDIYYKRLNMSTHSWSTPELVSSESTPISSSSSPSIAIDSAGNVHIVWEDSSDINGAGIDLDIFYKRYDVALRNWTTTEVVSTESANSSSAPCLAIDSSDNIHIMWTDFTNYAGAGLDADIFHKYYNVETNSWTTVEVISTESNADSLYPSFAIDSLDNLHVAWVDGTNYNNAGNDWDIFYKFFKQNTSSWSTTEVVFTESNAESLFPSLAIDKEDNIHIVWVDSSDYDLAGTDPDIFYKSFQQSTSSWTNVKVLSPECDYGATHPCLVVDDIGTIHVVWEDLTQYNEETLDDDIFFRIFAERLPESELASIEPNPTHSSNIELEWKANDKATHYYVYRNDTIIWSIEELKPIAEVTTNKYIDSLPDHGKFFYTIVAGNYLFNSSVSNCVSVVYTSNPPFFLQTLELRWLDLTLIIVALVGLQVLLFVLVKRKK
ncbi:MAG: hypothetical protein ACFFB0_17395 [Promethearchaeota archaeon]